MWVIRLKIRHDDWILDKILKYNITATGIPLNSYKKDGKDYHNGMVFLKGEKKNKDKFIKALSKDKRIVKFEVKKNQIFVLIVGEDNISNIMDNSLFFLKPVYFEKGYEYWEMGSWSKKDLTNFYEKVKKVADVTLLKLQKENPDIFIQYAIPRFTDNQRNAIEFAMKEGYYRYPRKNSVEAIAKKAKVPRSTYQEHLRKAESKLMNLLLQETK